MNSTMITEAYTNYMEALDKTAKAKLFHYSVCYQEAGKNGDSEKMRQAYHGLLAAVRAGEEATGIRLIASPDEQFLCALNAVSSRVYAFLNTEYTVTFSTLRQANDFLADRHNVTVTSVKIHTRTAPGLFANHANVARVELTLRLSWNGPQYRYGICQQEKTQLFTRSRVDKGFAKSWEAANPGLECVFLQHTSNARASSGSMVFGFGLDYVEHVKYFITYRKPITA